LQFYNAKKPVSAVCHGPAALVLAKRSDGKSILEGIPVTGFSNAEEAQTPYNDFEKTLPFSLEDKLTQLGGKYETGGDWQPKICWEGGVLTGKFQLNKISGLKLIQTGQNPQSAAPLGEKLREILLA
jgi:putative intracellular protease/amidase